jgi:aryl-alcohol dehydrogenase-like predicted oxidoreductase
VTAPDVIPRQVAGRTVFPIGFGAMLLGMEGRPDEATALRTVHAALDAGVRLVDTAINYGSSAAELGYCEALVGRALRSWSGAAGDVLVVGKGGNLRTDSASYVQDGSPANLRWSCEHSLRALGAESFGLYLLHSIDPAVPLAESLGALAELRSEGKVQHVGISNAGRRQLSEARAVVEIAAVENRLSPWSTTALPIVAACEESGTAFLAYSPLGGQGLAAGLGRKPAFAAVAAERGASPQQVALAWALAVSPVVVPIPSGRRPGSAVASAAAADLVLSADELGRLSADLGDEGGSAEPS